MEERRFVFRLTPYDTELLLPQVRKALEMRTELLSRQRYPALWAQTDHFRKMSKGRTRSRLRTTVMSLLCLVLGIVLLVPGLMEPEELFVPLVAGAVAVVSGVMGLWSVCRKPRDAFDAPARKLLSGTETIPSGQAVVIFTQEGFEISGAEAESRQVPYSEVETAVKMADALLIVYADRVMLLQDRDLAEGEKTDLDVMLRQKIGSYLIPAEEQLPK